MSRSLLVKRERIERRVLRFRGQNVLLDQDLAGLYGVNVKALNQAVKTQSRAISGRLHVPAHGA